MTDPRYTGLLGAISETADIQRDYDVSWPIAAAMQRQFAEQRVRDALPMPEPENNVIYVDFVLKRRI
jgi:hypothetical protein